MNNRSVIIKKISILVLWILVGASTVVLLVAANIHQGNTLCSGVAVKMVGPAKISHIPAAEIVNIVSGGDSSAIIRTPVKKFNLVQLESMLEKHLWIRNAELYFDKNGGLNAEIEERIPVARVFTKNGQCFYLDEKGGRLPVNTGQVAYVPVFTGFPFSENKAAQGDSILNKEIVAVGTYIIGNEKWLHEIDQIVWDSLDMRMLPAAGKFEIIFGRGEKVAEKFKRLQLFYDRILSNAGVDFYKTLDLRFDKQIVAFKRDSAHLLKTFLPLSDTIKIQPILADSSIVPKDTALVKNKKNLQVANTKNVEPPKKEATTKQKQINKKPKAVLSTQIKIK